jgi:hypothetical protein
LIAANRIDVSSWTILRRQHKDELLIGHNEDRSVAHIRKPRDEGKSGSFRTPLRSPFFAGLGFGLAYRFCVSTSCSRSA